MAEKLASSRIDRILGLIDDALDDGPCWRCETRSGTQQSGLCDQCRDDLRAEKAPAAASDMRPCGVVGDGAADDTAALAAAIEVSFCIPPGAIAVRLAWRTPDEMASVAFAAAVRNVSGDFMAELRDVREQLASTSSRFDEWAADLAEVFSEVGDEIAHVAHEWSATINRTWVNGVLVGTARPDEPSDHQPVPGRPKRKPPRTCPRHGVVMAGGLCRRCAR